MKLLHAQFTGDNDFIFGLLKRNGRVYTIIIPNAKADILMPIIRQKVKPSKS